MTDPVVIFDRDGVINEDSDTYIKSAAEWIPIPGSLEAIARLNHSGFRIGIVTNQSGLSRGLFDTAALAAMHEKLHELLAKYGARVEMIAYCPHEPKAACACRKPQPGLLISLGQRLGVDLRGVPLVGDSLTDIQVARGLGMVPWLVLTGKGQRTMESGAVNLREVRVVPDLRAVADQLLKGCPV